MSLVAPTSARVAGGRARYQADGGTALSSERAVVLLYQRLERDLDEAIDALSKDQPLAAHDPLVHAQEIIEALDATLLRDAWVGADALGSLYEHLIDQLVVANLSKDVDLVRHCRTIVAPLSEAWQQAWVETSSMVPSS
jgi:flagellar protein FliS